MPAVLVPHAEIPDLAVGVTPEMIEVLRRIQKAGFILNESGLDADTEAALKALTQKQLIDPGYEGSSRERPHLWVSNGNGSRVLTYLTGIRGGPHYEISSSALAAWLREQGQDRCWNVDGDPLLTGRMTFPCRAANLAAELDKIAIPLLVQAKKDDEAARGQVIDKDRLNDLVRHIADNVHSLKPGPSPDWADDRFFYLCWKTRLWEWMLSEDSRTTRQMRVEEGAHFSEAASVKKE